MDDAEAQRDAYVRGGDEQDRQQYGNAETRVTNALDRLEAMTNFDPVQGDRAEALRLYARVRMAELSAAVEVQRTLRGAAGSDDRGAEIERGDGRGAKSAASCERDAEEYETRPRDGGAEEI